MRLFIDTGNVAEVEEIAAWGILSGATTNPSLLAKEDGDPGESIKRICELVGGPTSAEVVSQEPKARVHPRSTRTTPHLARASGSADDRWSERGHWRDGWARRRGSC